MEKRKAYNVTYWEGRYKAGGDSGRGSVGSTRRWKWRQITNILGPRILEGVIDVGCGDLRFWEGRTCLDYTGIDISPFIIGRNKLKRPEWTFITAPGEAWLPYLNKPVVFCFDMLFHIMREDEFKMILENLARYSSQWIFIYTWIINPFRPQVSDHIYQYYRDLDHYLEVFKGFELYQKKRNHLDIGGLFVFKKFSQ